MDSLWGNLFKGHDKQKEQILNVLKNIPIFKGLSQGELDSIEHVLHRRQYQSDEVIFNQGAPGAGMYIIVEGDVSIVYELDDKSKKEIARLGDGEFFGELALLDESPRSASAISRKPSIVLGFFQSDLFSLAERNPKLGNKVILRLARIIGQRLKYSNDQIQAMREELWAIKEVHQ